MDRRDFLRTTGVATTAVAFTTPAARAKQPEDFALTSPELLLEAVCDWPAGARRLNGLLDTFHATLISLSGGRIALKPTHDAADGATDIRFRVPDPARDGAIGAILSGLPLPATTPRDSMLLWLTGGGGLAMLDRLASDHGRKLLAVGQTAPSDVLLSANGSPASNILAAGLTADALSAAGAPVQRITTREFISGAVTASGDFEAVVGVHPMDLALENPNLTLASTELPIRNPGLTVTASIDLKRWAELTIEQRSLIAAAAELALHREWAQTQAFLNSAWPAIAATRVARGNTVPADWLGDLPRASEQVLANAIAQNRDFAQLYDSYNAIVLPPELQGIA